MIDEFNPYHYKKYIKVSFLKNFKEFRGDDTEYQGRVLVVVQIKIGKTTTGPIYKYILVRDNLRWDYRKSREDIKRMIRIVEQLGISNDGYDLSKTEFESISSEKVVPRNILENHIRITWYPYDYDGSYNNRIKEIEHEKDGDFKLSLKKIDNKSDEMLERKKQKFRSEIISK
ncbi:hypothetical protein [Bacillus safensis]|uniref:hypothetical protein n=1 Tax=Bacillus safensis TaxID=561879 RepID=UPI00384F8F13